MNIELGGVGVGGYHEQGVLDVKSDAYIDNSTTISKDLGINGSTYIRGFISTGANITSRVVFWGQHSYNTLLIIVHR